MRVTTDQNAGDGAGWLLLIYRVPPEPTRLRSTVWRRIKSLGAICLLRSATEVAHLSGRIADVAFRGRGCEYAIDIPGLGRLTGVFARHRAERGDSAGMRLDPEGCHLFPAAGSTVPSVTAGERGPSPYIAVQ
jgi:TOBE domain